MEEALKGISTWLLVSRYLGECVSVRTLPSPLTNGVYRSLTARQREIIQQFADELDGSKPSRKSTTSPPPPASSETMSDAAPEADGEHIPHLPR